MTRGRPRKDAEDGLAFGRDVPEDAAPDTRPPEYVASLDAGDAAPPGGPAPPGEGGGDAGEGVTSLPPSPPPPDPPAPAPDTPGAGGAGDAPDGTGLEGLDAEGLDAMTARLAAEVKALDAERARLVRLQREAAALAYRRRSETLSRHSEAEIRARNSRVLEEAGLVQFGGDRHIIGSFRAELDALKREGGKG